MKGVRMNRFCRRMIVPLSIIILLVYQSPSWAAVQAETDAKIDKETASAVESWKEALKGIDPYQDAGRYAETLLRLAEAYRECGHHRQAAALLADYMPKIDAKAHPFEKTLLLVRQAEMYLSVGDVNAAHQALDHAKATANNAKSSHATASVLNCAGNLFAAEDDRQKAKFAYREALKTIERAAARGGEPSEPSLQLKATILINLLQLDAGSNVESLCNDILKAVNALPDNSAKADHLISAGVTLLEKRAAQEAVELSDIEISTAEGALQEAVRIALRDADAARLCCACGYLGQLREISGRETDAFQWTRRALFHSQQVDSPHLHYLWQWQLGRLLASNGDTKAALNAYQEAVDTLTPIRWKVSQISRGSQNRFYDKVRPVYLELAELLLTEAETEKDRDERRKMLLRARNAMETLKSAELQDFFDDECVAATERSEGAVLFESSPPGTAILYPIPFKNRLSILLTLPDGLEHFQVEVGEDRLSSYAHRYRRKLQNPLSFGHKRTAKWLYDYLIKPVEGKLAEQEVDTLVIAPDGALRLIPFSALHDGERFLIEKYAIVTIPGVQMTITGKSDIAGNNTLINGLSVAREDYPPLPAVPKEVRRVQEITNGKVLEDDAYTLGNLTTEFRSTEYGIVHMATHGNFGSSASESYLLTYDQRLTMDRLENLVGYGRFREKAVDLLTLSACQTAQGDERAALGLAGVAVKAGVRSAVATLWQVNDEATYQLIAEFYRQLKENPGISKAKALQSAQIHLIREPEYAHPPLWSPYLLIGNWM